uniref:Ig-like domain-containing protein n=1 Tax=Anopheles minimus TaxID=112268 RepID=A0A182W1B1_9DIPT
MDQHGTRTPVRRCGRAMLTEFKLMLSRLQAGFSVTQLSITVTIRVWEHFFFHPVQFGLLLVSSHPTRDKPIPVATMEALVGETIYMPCNVSTHEPGDNVVLVLWYREDKGSPIYSADTRGREVGSPKRWSDDAMFGDRAYFQFEKEPGELAVQNVRETDSGMYRCRVDFIVAQTRNSVVNLTII